MKKLLIILTVLLLTINGYSQADKVEKSKSQTVELLAKDGVLLKKEFYDMGAISGIKFQTLIITDLSTGKKIGALRLETSYYSSIGTDTYIGTLDSDEIDACIKSVKAIKDMTIQPQVLCYTECEYSSKDGVSCGAYSDAKSPWTIYVQTKQYNSRSMKSFKSEKIDEFVSILEKSLTDIKSKLN